MNCSEASSGESQTSIGSNQPFLGNFEDVIEPTPEPWGWFVPMYDKFHNVDFTKDSCVFGKGRPDFKPDYLFSEKDDIHRKIFNTISRIHFKIERKGEDVYLIDCSSFGTFINNEKVGKGNKRPLVHGDIIGVLQNLDSFRFLKKDEQEDEFKKTCRSKSRKNMLLINY